MNGVYSKHPLASWDLLHEAEQAVRDQLDDAPERTEVAWGDAVETVAVELSRPKSDAKTLLALLSDLGAIEAQPSLDEARVSVSTRKCQHNRSEGQMGGA